MMIQSFTKSLIKRKQQSLMMNLSSCHRSFHSVSRCFQQKQVESSSEETTTNNNNEQKTSSKKQKRSMKRYIKLGAAGLVLGVATSLASVYYENYIGEQEAKKDIENWLPKLDQTLVDNVFMITLSRMEQLFHHRQTLEAFITHFAPNTLITPDLNFNIGLNIDQETGKVIDEAITPRDLLNKSRVKIQVDYIRGALVQKQVTTTQEPIDNVKPSFEALLPVRLLRVSHLSYEVPIVITVKQQDRVVESVHCIMSYVYVKYDDAHKEESDKLPKDFFEQISTIRKKDADQSTKQAVIYYNPTPGGIKLISTPAVVHSTLQQI